MDLKWYEFTLGTVRRYVAAFGLGPLPIVTFETTTLDTSLRLSNSSAESGETGGSLLYYVVSIILIMGE